MPSTKSVVSSGTTSREVKQSAVQEHRSSTTQQSQKSHVTKSSGSETIEKSQKFGGNASATTTTTIYDADGNVVKTITNVDNKHVPSGQSREIQYTSTGDDSRTANEIRERSSLDTHDGRRINITHEYDNTPHSPTPSQSDSVATTYLVDENYVDMNKMRNKNAQSDFRSFYGHGVDSSKTVVGNAYDSNAVQNTIGTRGRVIMDHNIDTTDVVFSNDRNYGKTGWNGQFTDEEPQFQRVVERPKQKSWDKPSLRGKARLRPEDLPPAGVPSVRR